MELVKTLQKIYGKRIIIMGGGAQVGQVAIGAISEADRHNIRGEHISVDTIPLVGEQELADAVRAVARLPRAKALVLAGSLMGGDIETAVREVRAQGLLVVSLNMAGSVPDAADLVVTDPVQAGVMAVMAVADTAKFTIERLKRPRVLGRRSRRATANRSSRSSSAELLQFGLRAGFQQPELGLASIACRGRYRRRAAPSSRTAPALRVPDGAWWRESAGPRSLYSRRIAPCSALGRRSRRDVAKSN